MSGSVGFDKSDDAISDALAECQKALRRLPRSRRLRVLRGLFTWVGVGDDADVVIAESEQQETTS